MPFIRLSCLDTVGRRPAVGWREQQGLGADGGDTATVVSGAAGVGIDRISVLLALTSLAHHSLASPGGRRDVERKAAVRAAKC